MLIAILGWAVMVTLFLVAWARLHANMRAADGVDEELYVEGLDDASLAEAA